MPNPVDNVIQNEKNLRSRTYGGNTHTPLSTRRGRGKGGLTANSQGRQSNTTEATNDGGSKTFRTPPGTQTKTTNSANPSESSQLPPKRNEIPTSKGAPLQSNPSNRQLLVDEARSVNEHIDKSLNQATSMEDLLGFRDSLHTGSNQDLFSRQMAIDPNPSLLAELKRCKEMIVNLTLQVNEAKRDVRRPTPDLQTEGQNQNSRHPEYELRYRNRGDPGSSPTRSLPRPTANQSNAIDSSDSEESAHAGQRQFNTTRTKHQPCEMNKWPIKFSGGNGIKFLKKVEKLQASYGYDDETVYKYFYLLLEGHAIEWYWQFSDEYPVSNLRHLKNEFSRVFKPRQSDMSLISAMYSKKQGRDSFEKFYNELIDMNFTLKQPLPDTQIIEILRCNMEDDVRQRIFTFETNDRINFFHKANQAYHDACGVREKRKSFHDYRNPKKNQRNRFRRDVFKRN